MTNLIVSPKTFATYSLGCRTNQAEIESIGLQLIDCGLQQAVNKSQPDLILLNTCAVTGKAEMETRKEIRKLKRIFPKSFLVVIGCAVTAKEKFLIKLPEADLIISNADKSRALKIILKSFKYPHSTTHCSLSSCYFDPYIQSGRKFIKIQDGCDLFCSFCLTAHLRGKPTSIPPEKIIKEINYWVAKKIKEIILTGINISLYGKDLNKKNPIVDLLKQILKETKIERITFSSIYPEMLLPLTGFNPVNEFVELIVGNPRISQYFHLSLQSGSTSVLQMMNRKTDLNQLLASINQIKIINPFFTFRTDIIVGFPGEEESEFIETLEFIKKAKISFAHIFTFSKRIGTPASQMKDLPKKIKKERSKILIKTVEKIRNNEAKNQLNNITDCLVIRLLSENIIEGITSNGWPIEIKNYHASAGSRTCGDKLRIENIKGKILPVKIIGFKDDQLLGEILSLPTKS